MSTLIDLYNKKVFNVAKENKIFTLKFFNMKTNILLLGIVLEGLVSIIGIISMLYLCYLIGLGIVKIYKHFLKIETLCIEGDIIELIADPVPVSASSTNSYVDGMTPAFYGSGKVFMTYDYILKLDTKTDVKSIHLTRDLFNKICDKFAKTQRHISLNCVKIVWKNQIEALNIV